MATLHRQVESRLAENETRYTRGRRSVVDALVEADGPRSAAELSPELSGVPLSSLYRTLSVLEDAGVVTPHLATKGIARYELAEWLMGHHHHLVCVDCGSVEDVVVSDAREARLHELVDAIAHESGFSAASHALEIEGTCGRCR